VYNVFSSGYCIFSKTPRKKHLKHNVQRMHTAAAVQTARQRWETASGAFCKEWFWMLFSAFNKMEIILIFSYCKLNFNFLLTFYT